MADAEPSCVGDECRGEEPEERQAHRAFSVCCRRGCDASSRAAAVQCLCRLLRRASKAVAEGRYTNLPKPSSFIRTSAASVVDYVANPIEHIIGIEPLPSWDPYVGRTVETDARLRLASLQAWIRQGAQEGNVVTRLAKAGQTLYDPFTGLPMLVDQRKGVLSIVLGKTAKIKKAILDAMLLSRFLKPNRLGLRTAAPCLHHDPSSSPIPSLICTQRFLISSPVLVA